MLSGVVGKCLLPVSWPVRSKAEVLRVRSTNAKLANAAFIGRDSCVHVLVKL